MHSSSMQALGRLSREVLKKTFLFVFILLLTIAQVGLTIYLPILIGRAVNTVVGVEAVDFVTLKELLVKMLIVIGANTAVQVVNPMLYNRMIYQIVEKLREQVFSKIHSLPLSFIDQQAIGDLVSRITTDTEQLSDGLLMIFEQFFTGLLTIILTIITMARLDIRMMLIVVLMTPLSLFVAHFIAKKSYYLFSKQALVRGEHTNIIEESIQEGDLVKLYNLYSHQEETFHEVNEEYAHYSKWAIFYSSIVNPTTRFINALIYAVLTAVGAIRVMSGNFTVGELTIFLNYANQYTKPFNDISSVLAELQGALACAERIYAMIDQEDQAETGLLTYDIDEIQGHIQMKDVDFSYVKGQDLIEDLNLDVRAGQTIAIVGPTGAGKSTLINLLMRFYDLDHGFISIDEQDIAAHTRASVRELFGMVLQETWMKSGSIHDNIAYGYPGASREEVIRAAKAAHAHHFIEMLPEGYDTVIDGQDSGLSTGQEQLIAIARIFVSLPKMLILDEATSSIDSRTEILIQQAFDRLMEGRTSFIIAHRLSTIQEADVILVLKDGNIIEKGNHHELMKAEGFYYQMQTAIDDAV